MRKSGGKKGFTMVELALAVGFIGLLSLTIVLIINDTVETYRRGITLNQINTTGMDLVDDIRAAIQDSPARRPEYECEALFTNSGNCTGNLAKSLVHLERKTWVEVDGVRYYDIPVYGVICTGAYSYIWNSGYFFVRDKDTHMDPTVKMASFNAGGVSEYGFRLLKVKDDWRGVCKSALWKMAGSNDPRISYSTPEAYDDDLINEFGTGGPVDYFSGRIDGERDVEVVLDSEPTNPLALYDFSIVGPATDSASESAFYSVSFILGSLTGGINVMVKGNFCRPPEGLDDGKEEAFNYCAINKFNFAAQAGDRRINAERKY